MNSSAKIYILHRVAELARRNGLSVADADAHLELEFADNRSQMHLLKFENEPTNAETLGKFNRVLALLGCDEDGIARAPSLAAMEQRVERAIDLSPRLRTR